MKYTEIGSRIKARRKELDLSAVELASRLSLSKATIHRYESGDIRNIKLPIVEMMARELCVNPAWLIGKSEQKEILTAVSEDLAVKLDELIQYVRETACLMANGREVSKEQRRIIATGLGFTRDYVSKI